MINQDLTINMNFKMYKNGELVVDEHNLVVNSGLNLICHRMRNDDQPFVTHMALGFGTGAAQLTDVALENQNGVRNALMDSVVVDNTIEYSARFEGTDHPGAITEAGIFNDVTAGTMLNRVVFGVVTINEPDTITVVWKLTFANKE